MPTKFSVNYDAILDFINFEFVLCNETFHQDIKVLGHGERLEWNGERLISRRYWDYPDSIPSCHGTNTNKYLEGTFYALRNAVKRRIEGKSSIGVTLSSGLDSRLIAACVAELRSEPVHCYHLGQPKHNKSLWAAEICRRLNGNFNSIALWDLEFGKLLDSTYKMLAGQFSLNQATILWLLSSLDIDDSYILDGQVQDALLNNPFIAVDNNSRVKPCDYSEDIVKFHQPLNNDLIKIVLEEKWAKHAISSRPQRINDHFQGRIFEDVWALTTHFYYTARGQRYVWGSPVLEYSLVNVGCPGMDYEFFDWAIRLPIELRGPDAILYRNMLCTYCKDVATVPWDATGTPLNTFMGRIRPDYSLKGKEFWVHIIRRVSSGRIDLSNTFLDKDILFRKNRKFREAILEPVSLLDNVPHILISNVGIEKLARLIMQGRNYFPLLQNALTVLNFYKHCHD